MEGVVLVGVGVGVGVCSKVGCRDQAYRKREGGERYAVENSRVSSIARGQGVLVLVWRWQSEEFELGIGIVSVGVNGREGS